MKNFIVLLILFPFFLIHLEAQTVQNKAPKTQTKRSRIYSDKDGMLTTHKITQNRKMSGYDDGGNFDCNSQWMLRLNLKWKGTQPKGICDENRIRDFIWQHWSERRHGYIRIAYLGIDTSATWHVFIEPNKLGKWGVTIRIVGTSALPGSHASILELRTMPYVEKQQNQSTDTKWSIVFKMVNGEAVHRLPQFQK
jgi:hypothetical protein